MKYLEELAAKYYFYRKAIENKFITLFSINKQKIFFIIIGIWNTIFGYSAFALLMYLYSSTVNYSVILAISYLLGITNAYIFYKLFVFKTVSNIFNEYIRFCVTYFAIFIINLVTLPILVELMMINVYIAQALILGISIVVSFAMHQNYTFKEQ